MRYIAKREEPGFLSAWKQRGNGEWTPSYAALQQPEKSLLLSYLLIEQGGTCCYCGRSIQSEAAHIEHFRPQSKYPTLALTYINLFASCIRETKPGAPLHCGHLKNDWFEEDCHLSPSDCDCEQSFSYDLSGEAEGLNSSGKKMVEILGLNTPSLRAERQNALNGVFDTEFIESASKDELRTISQQFRKVSKDGFSSCFQVIARYAEQLLDSDPA